MEFLCHGVVTIRRTLPMAVCGDRRAPAALPLRQAGHRITACLRPAFADYEIGNSLANIISPDMLAVWL